jgi:glucokinase
MMQTSPSINTQWAIGLDIGGTKMSSALVNPEGQMNGFQHIATPTESELFLNAIETLVKEHQRVEPQHSFLGLGIATAGIVDPIEGKILGATGNLPAVRGISSLKQILESRLGIPVMVENDANAAAYGEARGGAAKGFRNVLMITLGTGVGTGIIIDGKILHGAHFSAGEGGHIFISQAKERLCTCGKWDCWETYASGTGLGKTAHRMLKATPNADTSQLMVGKTSVEEVTTHDVIAAFRSGDPLAEKMLDAWHVHVATGLASLLNVLDPDITVVGGGMAQFVDFPTLLRLTQERSMVAGGDGLNLVPATLGNQAGIVGAAFLARDQAGA